MRIVQVGLGPLGRRVLEDLRDRGLGQVVGAVDVDPDLVGRELCEVVPGSVSDGVPDGVSEGVSDRVPDWGSGVRVVGSVAELPDLDVVDAALVTTSSSLEACVDTFVALLERRWHVLSSCEELAYPWLRHPLRAAELHERCVRARRSLLGTGVNPGFLMDALPVFASGVSRSVERVEAWRIQDAAPRRVPFQRKIGAGLDPAAFEQRQRAGTLGHVGLGESLHLVAHYLGLELDGWDETLEPVIAEAPLECALGPIPAGHAAGVRQVAEGRAGDELRVRLLFQAAIGQPDPHDRVRITGQPPIDLRIEGGVHGDVATAALLLNAVGSVREAQPGLHTVASVRPPRCQAPC